MDTIKKGMNRRSHQIVQNAKNTKLCTMSNNHKTKNTKPTIAIERLEPLEFAPTESSTPIKITSARRDRSRGKDRRCKKPFSPTHQDSGFESQDSDSGLLDAPLNLSNGSLESQTNFSDDSGVSSLESCLSLSKGTFETTKRQAGEGSPGKKVDLLDLFRSQLNVSEDLDCSAETEKETVDKLERIESGNKELSETRSEKKQVDILGLVKSKLEISNEQGCEENSKKKNVGILGLVNSHFNDSKNLECLKKEESKKVDLSGLVNSNLNSSNEAKTEKKDVNLLALLKSTFESDTSGYESNKTDESVKVDMKGFKLKKGKIPCLPEKQRFACTVYDVEPKEPIPDIPDRWKAGFMSSLKFPKLSLIE